MFVVAIVFFLGFLAVLGIPSTQPVGLIGEIDSAWREGHRPTMQTNVPKIIQLYQDELLSIEQIAEALHIRSSTVHKWLVRKNVQRRTKTSNVGSSQEPRGQSENMGPITRFR
jgi:predicted Rossmann fold nucleotide-binding protein DprA/Smf involved in DNA uptake